MRLRTLAAGMTLAIAGLVTSAAQADLSIGLATETRADTGLPNLDTETNAEAGVKINVLGASQADAQGQASQRSELAGDGRAEAGIHIEQESQGGLDRARDKAGRTGHEVATKAHGQAQSALDGATDTLDAARESGEARAAGRAAVEAEGSADVTTGTH